jgi:DNA-binding NarL/FixJ family response regulator
VTPARPRVLLADDSPDLARAVSRLLSSDCDVVGVIDDGSALLGAARQLRPDVIVLDLSLPNAHGLEACRQVTQAHPEIRVIVFTALGDPEVAQQALAMGASAFVSKLASAHDLLLTIKRLCEDRRKDL